MGLGALCVEEGSNDWGRNAGEAREVCIQQQSLSLVLLLPESWGEGQGKGRSTKIFLSCLSGRKGDASACNTSWLVSLRGRPPG